MQTIYLDISNKGVIQTIYAKQGDIGRKFKAVVLESGIPRAITNETFSAGYDGASGSGNYEKIGDRSAFEVVGNAVTVEIAPNALLAPGTSNFCLTMSGLDGTVIGLWNILVNVEETPGFLGDPIEDYYPGISAVLFVDQNLSEDQKAKARANIGSGTGNVKSVNGATPDENGNVVVTVGGGEGTPSTNVFLGNKNTTVAEYYKADQAGKICFMDRAMAGSGLWTWMMVNVNAFLARFHTTDSGGNILHGILTSSGEWSYKAAEQGNNVFIGDENTSVSEYYEEHQAGKVCFMRRPYGGSGIVNWVAYNCHASGANFYHVNSTGRLEYGTLTSDGSWNYKSVLPGTVKSVNGITPGPNGNVEITIPDSGQNSTVDLTGYAKETWVLEGFQPKGNYLTEIPVATNETLGGVKNGGNVVINPDGTMDAPEGGAVTDEQISNAVKEYLNENPIEVVEGNTTICTFLDAYVAWCNGDTFPVAFYGDSTFCGAYGPGVGGAFPALLQALLREECGENATIYNASNSGHNLVNGINNFDTYFGESGTYADSKMVGIGFGINDRLSHSSYKEYKETVYANLETIVNKCFERGIQPFIVTSHATNECGVQSDYTNAYPMRTSGAINIAANGAKKELAEKYGLPLIDLNKFTELFMVKSKVAAKDISADRLHYTAKGNSYEAGVMFSQFVTRTIFTNGKEENAITYSSQNITSAVPEDKISYGGEYKVFANYTKEDTTDTKIMDVYLFVYDSAVPVYALKNIAESATYVLVNGTKYAMADISEFLGEFDLGLHHLEVYTGESNIVDFCAFSINGDIVAATGVNLSTYALTVDQRKSCTITATPEPENAYGMVSWSSSNEEVVTVSDGVVSLVGEGDAIVIAKIGANEAQCAVTVVNLAQYSEMAFDIDQTTGEVIAGSKSVSDLVSVEPGYQYYISTEKSGGLYPTVAGYTEDGIFIKMLATGNAQYNAHYDIAEWESIRKIRIAWKPFNASIINVKEPIRTNNGVWSTKVYAINTETGEIGVSTNWLKYSITLQRIPVEAGTPYLVKSTIDPVYGDRIVLLEYDADGEFVKGYDAGANVNKIEFTSTANTASVMLAFSTNGSGKLQITKVE